MKGQIVGHYVCALVYARNVEKTRALAFHQRRVTTAPWDGWESRQTASARRVSLENTWTTRTQQTNAKNAQKGLTRTSSGRKLAKNVHKELTGTSLGRKPAKNVAKGGTLTSPRGQHAEHAPLATGAIAYPTTILIPTAIHAVLESTSLATIVSLRAQAVKSAPKVNIRTNRFRQSLSRAKSAR